MYQEVIQLESMKLLQSASREIWIRLQKASMRLSYSEGVCFRQRLVSVLTQDQLKRSQRTRNWVSLLKYEIILSFQSIWLIQGKYDDLWFWVTGYLGTSFFGKGSDTSFTSQVSPPLALCQLILSQDWNHLLVPGWAHYGTKSVKKLFFSKAFD